MAKNNNNNNSSSIKLKSSDGRIFSVREAVAAQSETIKQLINDGCADSMIPLPNVTARILSKVIDYCKRHVDEEDDLEAFDAKFVKVDKKTLFGLVLAANYLNIKNLLDLTCRAVGDMITGDSPEHIRRTFGIKNDFTHEEEWEINICNFPDE